MPLDQDIEGRHGEGEPGMKILPDPVHDFLEVALRHEVAKLIVWHVVSTRPVVPSTVIHDPGLSTAHENRGAIFSRVSYEDVREGNAPYRALGHGTHSHLTGTQTVRQRCLCQHQAEMGWMDGMVNTCELSINVVMSTKPKMLPGLSQKAL